MTQRRCYNHACLIPICETCHQDWLCSTCLSSGVKGIKVKNRLTRGKKRKESTSIETPSTTPEPLQKRFQDEHIPVSSTSKHVQEPTPLKKPTTTIPKITKIVRVGKYFQEHIFMPKSETWIGSWRKCGQERHLSESAKEVFDCSSCEEDKKKRWSFGTPTQKLRSYQVENFTKSSEFWPWEFGLCGNKKCWGPYDRTLKIQRHKNNPRFYQFSNYKQVKTSKNAPERIDQLYVTMEQQKGVIYSGIARPVGFCSFFWPLFKDEHVLKKRHIHVEFLSKQMLPENLIDVDRAQWPPFYKHNNDFKYPNQIQFRIFEEGPSEPGVGLPDSIFKLENSGWPEVGRAFAFMYPGGAGCRVEYFKFCDGPSPKERVETPETPLWWPGNNRTSGYRKNIQAGWAGPLISFWKRTSDINEFFS
jgi:hypothetical protein